MLGTSITLRKRKEGREDVLQELSPRIDESSSANIKWMK